MFPKRLWSVLVLALLALFVLAGCGPENKKVAAPDPNVVASFSGGMITKDQIQAKYDNLMSHCQERYAGEEGHRALIKEMVLPVVISQAIQDKKIDLRNNIRKELGDLKAELNMSLLHMKFHEKILKDNTAYGELKEAYDYQKRMLEGLPLSERYDRLLQIHEQIHPELSDGVEAMTQHYIQKLRREASISKNYQLLQVEVTEEELKDFYRRHKEGLHDDEYRIPERVRVQQIAIRSEADVEIQQAKAKADLALLELKSGADFAAVAQDYAADPVAAVESQWITLESENEKAPFDQAVFSLETGDISPVIAKGDAFYIVRVLEKQPERFKTYAEISGALEREYRWQKGEQYLKENRDRILFTIDGRPYTVGDFLDEYTRANPPHQCHHKEEEGDHQMDARKEGLQLCDFAHNNVEEQKTLVDRMIDKELIIEDTYNQMIHVEHQEEIEFATLASLYPIFHKEEMENLIHITDEMIQAYYQKEKKNYRYPAKAKLNMIVIKGGESEEDRKKALAEAQLAHSELKPSFFSFKRQKDFAEVARKYSDDKETASKGGRIEVDVYECRNAVEYMLMHGFHEEIFGLKPGDISDIFEYGNDYYIIQVREMESGKMLQFEEVREQVKQDLMAKEHQSVMNNWEENLLKAAGFVIYDKPLQELLAKQQEAPNTEGS